MQMGAIEPVLIRSPVAYLTLTMYPKLFIFKYSLNQLSN